MKNTVKKKRVVGIFSAMVFLVWLLVEVWAILPRFTEHFEYMLSRNLLTGGDALLEYIFFVGRPAFVLHVAVALLTVTLFGFSFWGAGKPRLNAFALISAIAVFAGFTLVFLSNIKNGVTENPVDMVYELLSIVFPVSMFLLVFMTAVSVTGNSAMMQKWIVPGVLYAAGVLIYVFGVEILKAYNSPEITLYDILTTHNIMQLFFAIGVVALGYWISLYMTDYTLMSDDDVR